MSAYVTTSTLNNITKWKGPGDDAYAAAAATLSREVRVRHRARMWMVPCTESRRQIFHGHALRLL